METIRNFSKKFNALPDKKRYFEFITAFLSIPVLLSVVYINYLSIQEKRISDELTPTPGPSVVTVIQERDPPREPSPTDSDEEKECTPGIGQASITTPKENETITQNPLEIVISYSRGAYCAVVWSYRINGGSWSEFSDKNIVIYNMPSGAKKLELRVKSIVSGEEQTIERTFTYTNTQEIPTPVATSTATPTPSPTGTVQGASVE